MFISFTKSLVYVALGLLISLQPTFYPSEAELKGAKPSEYGFVFGVANLSLFIFSPIFGKYASKIGLETCFNIGAIMQGVSGLLFAFVPYLDNVALFLFLSYLFRFLEGLGTAMAWSSSLGILTDIFPEWVASAMALTQASFGFGYMLGPAVGAYFYDVGGFSLPFLICGSIDTILAMLLLLTIPTRKSDSSPKKVEKEIKSDDDGKEANSSIEGGKQENSEKEIFLKDSNTSNGSTNSRDNTMETSALGFKELIKNPALMVPFVDLFACLCGVGMIESMLEPHLRESGATTLTIGLSFLGFGCCYSVGNMVFGRAIDCLGSKKSPQTKYMQALLFATIGNVLYAIVFVFIGPIPFISLNPTTQLISGMMALAGLTYGIVVPSSFSRATSRVIQAGYPNESSTNVMISGLWLSVFSLGNFVGPTISGVLVQVKGFRFTTLIFFVLYLVMLLFDIIEAIKRKIQEKRQSI